MELVTHTLSPIIYTSKTCCHTELNTGLKGPIPSILEVDFTS